MTVHMTQSATELELFARSHVATALACAFADPKAPLAAKGKALAGRQLEAAWAVVKEAFCAEARPPCARGEREPHDVDVAGVSGWLRLDDARREATYREVFGLVAGKTCPPLESEYVPWKDSTHRAQHLADIAGFYCAFGLRPDPAFPEHQDHVSLELSFVAFLLEKRAGLVRGGGEHAQTVVCVDAERSFLADHVAWWMPVFACVVERRVDQLLATGDHAAPAADLKRLRAAAIMLAAFVRAERVMEQVAPPNPVAAELADEAEDGGCGSGLGCAAPR